MFPTIRVDHESAEAAEWMGTKRKFWFSRGEERWLFKAEERGTGEDWAEKIACELATRLGIPHVNYELAEEFEADATIHPGVISPHCAPKPLNLVLGNQLLLARDPHYPGEAGRRYKVKEYTVEAVVECLSQLAPPTADWTPNLPAGVSSAVEIFAGYIMLDAWLANQDRHHENWAAIRVPDSPILRLAPTFDHGACLARNLSDEERLDRLESRDGGRRLPHFVARARSAFYSAPDDARPLGTIDAFVMFAKSGVHAAERWLERLRSVTPEEIEYILREVPTNRMSPVALRFTQELLLLNQQRLSALSFQ